MGFEGANVIFDAWVHPLVMGLEEHLLGMFSEDFEFHNDAQASHLGGKSRRSSATPPAAAQSPEETIAETQWSHDATEALSRIPFFVRGKARKNTETFARERGLTEISVETLYDAKAHFSR
jgi:light-independent protochlorophyllide reductase subunit B